MLACAPSTGSRQPRTLIFRSCTYPCVVDESHALKQSPSATFENDDFALSKLSPNDSQLKHHPSEK
jgi:hypothetical protein